jgi:hypothetical protein
MRRVTILFLFGLCAVLANAQVLTLADVKGKGAVQLSADDLKQLIPGAKVVSRTDAGSTRRWENKADGTFVASSDSSGKSGRARPSSGNGTWRVADGGTYCVDIQWNVAPEKWCRHIFKASDKYYGVGKLEDSAPAHELEFSK